MSNLSDGEFSCCVAKEDDVDGEGTGLAIASKDSGRGRPKGIENVLAIAANDGKDDEDVVAVADIGNAEAIVSGDDASGDVGEGMYRSFNGGGGGDGVRGGGGWPSEVSHASRAAFSS